MKESKPRQVARLATRFFKIERYALTSKRGRRQTEGKPEGSESITGQVTALRKRCVATNPECKGAQIFQNKS